MRYPKFERKLKQDVVESSIHQRIKPGFGIVLDYDPMDNSATVLMAQPQSNLPGEFYTGVPCPTTMGVQSTAPEAGRPCWIEFRDGTDNPIITHFFNHAFDENEHEKHNAARNNIPRFIMEL